MLISRREWALWIHSLARLAERVGSYRGEVSKFAFYTLQGELHGFEETRPRRAARTG